jgi:hypothetical protein
MYFLGDPPPDPRFLTSLGALQEAQILSSLLVGLEGPQMGYLRGVKSVALGFTGGRPCVLVSYRTSWGILPQTPVFSLRSARCHRYSSITALLVGLDGFE